MFLEQILTDSMLTTGKQNPARWIEKNLNVQKKAKHKKVTGLNKRRSSAVIFSKLFVDIATNITLFSSSLSNSKIVNVY